MPDANEHLVKARAALEGAKETVEAAELNDRGLLELRDAEEFSRRLRVSEAQATVSQAEALWAIAEALNAGASACS